MLLGWIIRINHTDGRFYELNKHSCENMDQPFVIEHLRVVPRDGESRHSFLGRLSGGYHYLSDASHEKMCFLHLWSPVTVS